MHSMNSFTVWTLHLMYLLMTDVVCITDQATSFMGKAVLVVYAQKREVWRNYFKLLVHSAISMQSNLFGRTISQRRHAAQWDSAETWMRCQSLAEALEMLVGWSTGWHQVWVFAQIWLGHIAQYHFQPLSWPRSAWKFRVPDTLSQFFSTNILRKLLYLKFYCRLLKPGLKILLSAFETWSQKFHYKTYSASGTW